MAEIINATLQKLGLTSNQLNPKEELAARMQADARLREEDQQRRAEFLRLKEEARQKVR